MAENEVGTAPRFARVVVAAVVVALLAVHLLRAIGQVPANPAVGLATAAALLGIFVIAVAQSARDIVPLIGFQVALAYLAVLPLGASVGVLAVPMAVLMLRRLWPALALVVVSVVWIEAARSASARDTVDMTLSAILGSVMLYAITTLARLANRVHEARLTRAASAVTAERLRIAGELETDLDAGLSEIRAAAADGTDPETVIASARRTLAETRAIAGELRSLSLAPEMASARALLESAGVAVDIHVGHLEPLGPAGTVLAMVLRETVTAVVRRGDARSCEISTVQDQSRIALRVVSDGVRDDSTGSEPLSDLARRVALAGGRISAELRSDGKFAVQATVAAARRESAPPDDPELVTALSLYAVLLVSFCVRTLLFVPPRLVVPAIVCVIAICLLQVRYSIQDETRYGRLALLVSTAIALVPLHWFGRNWIGAVGILAASILLALPLRLAILAIVALLVVSGTVGQSGVGDVVNALVTCLVVYGLLRLVRLVRELQDASAELARVAVLAERLRAARDLHDLLGHGLTAILLKAELARRVATRDPARCRTELRDIARIAERSHSELRTVSAASGKLAFANELASAAAVLAGAGVAVEVDGDRPPADVESLLSVVLREAVTNVLRHSVAKYVRIAVRTGGESVRLDVENDGVTGDVSMPGSGIGGLTIRLAEVGGQLAAGADDGWFLVRAEVPVCGDRSPITASPLLARSAPHRSGSER